MHYYEPVLDAIRISDPDALRRDQVTLVNIEGADVKVGVHPAIAKYLDSRQWDRAQHAAREAAESIAGEGYQPDGLKVVAGQSWLMRFAEPGMAEEG
jgi:hypothetical protein